MALPSRLLMPWQEIWDVRYSPNTATISASSSRPLSLYEVVLIKFYLDEDLSPKIAEIVRKSGIDTLSAHEAGMCEASDQRQLEFAATEKRCLVTRNRGDFIRFTVRFFNDQRPHGGVLIVPYTLPEDQFSRIASLIKKFSSRHHKGLAPYSIAFLPTK